MFLVHSAGMPWTKLCKSSNLTLWMLEITWQAVLFSNHFVSLELTKSLQRSICGVQIWTWSFLDLHASSFVIPIVLISVIETRFDMCGFSGGGIGEVYLAKISFWRCIMQNLGLKIYPPGNDDISHLGKRKIIFQKCLSVGYVIVPRRVLLKDKTLEEEIPPLQMIMFSFQSCWVFVLHNTPQLRWENHPSLSCLENEFVALDPHNRGKFSGSLALEVFVCQVCHEKTHPTFQYNWFFQDPYIGLL